MLIHFVHRGDAYLPELQAYKRFVEQAGHGAQVHRTTATIPRDATVIWWMCGNVNRSDAVQFSQAFHVHEYASASVPPMAWLKDYVKCWTQAVPQYRIFQNDWVRERLGFNDGVPYDLRDMGLAPEFFESQSIANAPEFDFVYSGEMSRLQGFLPLFQALDALGRNVLLVGQIPDTLKRTLSRHTNLRYSGRVAHADVPAQLRRARFGLNLVPCQLPYSHQTSTKLLEYCAAGLRVVTTDYAWVRAFERRHRCQFAYLSSTGTSATYQQQLGSALDSQSLVVPDLQRLAWPKLLVSLRVWRQIGATV